MIKSKLHIFIFQIPAIVIYFIAVIFISPAIAQNNNFVNETVFQDSVIGLIYHRFGEDKYPTTSVSIQQIDMQIAELTSGKYNVIPLIEAINAISTNKKLPPYSVVITIDDAFRSFYENGWPKFKAANLPVTLFITTGSIDQHKKDFLSWDDLRQMKKEGLDIQSHGHNHHHLVNLEDDLIKYEIGKSRQIIKQKLDIDSKIFAYPYGETSLNLMRHIKDAGFIAAFGQHSGGMTSKSNKFYLPRFSINMIYGKKERFKQTINSIGLPVTDLTPINPFLENNKYKNPPSIGFTIAKDIDNIKNIACYHSKTGIVKDIELLGKKRIEIRFKQAFAVGRTRINCTIPTNDSRWYWLGMQYYAQ